MKRDKFKGEPEVFEALGGQRFADAVAIKRKTISENGVAYRIKRSPQNDVRAVEIMKPAFLNGGFIITMWAVEGKETVRLESFNDIKLFELESVFKRFTGYDY